MAEAAQAVEIEYIGRKAVKRDNVANTGLSWIPGESHLVSVAAARLLLAHPDVWRQKKREGDPVVPSRPLTARVYEAATNVAIAPVGEEAQTTDPDPADAVGEAVAAIQAETTAENAFVAQTDDGARDLSKEQTEDVADLATPPNINFMTKDQLLDFAKKTYGKEFAPDMTVRQIRSAIVGLENKEQQRNG